MSWFSEHFDTVEKILTVVVAIIVAGVVGYFSGILAIRGDISKISERVTALETHRKDDLNKINKIETMQQEIQQLKIDIDHAKKIREMTAETNKRLDAIRVFWEQRTVEELEKLLKTYGKKSP